MPDVRKKTLGTAGFICLLCLLYWSRASGLFSGFENKISDITTSVSKNFSNPPKHVRSITVIKLDDYSLKQFEYRPPLPRTLYANLIKKLKPASPKMIVFDLVFTGSSHDPTQDYILAGELSETDNVLLSAYYGPDGGLVHPHPMFITGNVIGIINKPFDKDGYIRRAQTAFSETIDGQEILRPSLEVLIAQKALAMDNLKIDKTGMYKDGSLYMPTDNYTFGIDYSTRFEDITAVSLYDFLKNPLQNALYKDAVVIVTSTSKAEHDYHLTPIGLQPGAGVLINTLLTIMNANPVVKTPLLTAVLSVLCAVAVFIAAHIGLGPITPFITAAVLGLAAAAAAIIARMSSIDISLFALWLYTLSALIYTIVINYISIFLDSKKMRDDALRDDATGFFIGKYVRLKLIREMAVTKRAHTDLAYCMVSIDDFHALIGSFMTKEQEAIVKEAAQRIRRAVHQKALCGYMGNGIFSILLRHSGSARCLTILNTLKKEFESYPIDISGVPVKLTATYSAAVAAPGKYPDTDSFLEDCELAHIRAKEQGPGTIYIHGVTEDTPVVPKTSKGLDPELADSDEVIL